MASTVIRTTYALDAATVEKLDRLARSWKLSRSAALRKLIRERKPNAAGEPNPQLAALRRLQKLGKQRKPEEIEAWLRAIRQEREAWTDRLERIWKGSDR